MTENETVVGGVEIRILAVIVVESPSVGYATSKRLDKGIVGIDQVDLACGCRNLVRHGLLKRHSSNNLQLTDEGWAFIEAHQAESKSCNVR